MAVLTLDSENINEFIAFKQKFLSSKKVDPLRFPLLNPDIALSWKRSQQYGVDPNMPNVTMRIRDNDYKRLHEKYQTLIDAAKSLFELVFFTIQKNTLVLSLITPSGIFLLRQGHCSNKCILQPDAEVLLSNEQTAGTSAHALTFQFKRAFGLLGIEHYRNRFEDSVTFAAPVSNNNQIVAAVGLRQYLPLKEQKDAQEELEYSLRLVSVLASIFEAKLRQDKDDKLANTDHLLNTAFNIMDQGILTITKQGKILFGNDESSRLFGIDQEKIKDYNIAQFLLEDSAFLKTVIDGHEGCMDECFLIKNKPCKYKVSVHPISLNGGTERYVVKFISPLNSTITISNDENKCASYTFDDIIGSSAEMRQVIGKAKCYARSGENILIMGESGTGKELIAQAIHNERRPNGPFIAINCSALPHSLAISELFGYESGSFSGAERKGRIGKIELANSGTLFLDEIGDMPLDLQPVLLRVLQDKQIMRIGGQSYKKLDFHLICATNKNLEQACLTKQFRRDLYYRISTLVVKIPPLHERKEDLKDLCDYFLIKHGYKNRMVSRISKSAMEAITDYDWPGNVRQLENAIINALISARGKAIEIQDLPDYVTRKPGVIIPVEESTAISEEDSLFDLRSYRRLDKELLSKVMKKFNGNVALTAEYLGVSRSTIYRRLKTFKLND